MNLFSANWWVSTFVSTFVTMCFIVLIKKIGTSADIPLVSTVAENV